MTVGPFWHEVAAYGMGVVLVVVWTCCIIVAGKDGVSEYEMEERRLFDAGPRLKTVDLGHPITGRAKGWWATKCLDCGVWVSKYDFTAEESRELSKNHACEEAR